MKRAGAERTYSHADGLSSSPCALDARVSKPIQTRTHPPDSQKRTHASGRFRRTLDTYRQGMM
eukprot:5544088-Prymnesium_polylepis.1